MLSIRLEIDQIDYEKSLGNLLPPVVEKCRAKSSPSEPEKLLRRLGPDAVPVAQKLLGYLGDKGRDAVIVWLVEDRREDLTAAANRYLEEALPGGVIRIGGLRAEDRPGPRLGVLAYGVRIDYAALLKSPLVESGVASLGNDNPFLKGAAKFALQMGAKMSPETLEKQGIALLSSDAVKAKLLTGLSEGLEKMGLVVRFRDMALKTDDAAPPAQPKPAGDQGLIPDAIEDFLLDALCALLRDTVKGK